MFQSPIDLPLPPNREVINLRLGGSITTNTDQTIQWFKFRALPKIVKWAWQEHRIYEFLIYSQNSRFFAGLWGPDPAAINLLWSQMRQPIAGKTKLVRWARRECPPGVWYLGVFLDRPSPLQVGVRQKT